MEYPGGARAKEGVAAGEQDALGPADSGRLSDGLGQRRAGFAGNHFNPELSKAPVAVNQGA